MNIVARIKYTLFQPAPQWAGEQSDVARGTSVPAKAHISYTAILATLLAVLVLARLATFPAVTAFIFGHRVGDSPLSASMAQVMTGVIISGALSLGGAYLLARIINALAPIFGGTKNMEQALRLAMVSTAAFWLAHVFSMMPGLRFVEVIGLYGVYVLYKGLPGSMKLPKSEAVPYVNIIIIVAIAVFLLMCAAQAVATGGACM